MLIYMIYATSQYVSTVNMYSMLNSLECCFLCKYMYLYVQNGIIWFHITHFFSKYSPCLIMCTARMVRENKSQAFCLLKVCNMFSVWFTIMFMVFSSNMFGFVRHSYKVCIYTQNPPHKNVVCVVQQKLFTK